MLRHVRILVGICLIAGCSHPMPARPSQPASVVATPAPIEVPRATYDAVPAELGDAHVFDKILHRAIVRRWELARLAPDAMPFGTSGKVDRAFDIQPVIGETAREVRIVVEDDDARVAAWVPRADLADTVLAPVQLADRAGAPRGVWIAPGVSLASGPHGPALREVEAWDESIVAFGFAPARLIGQVWVAGAGEAPLVPFGHTRPWKAPKDPRPAVRVADGAVVRVGPGADAEQIARLAGDDLVGAVVSQGAAATEVELVRPFVRVRGFVETAKVTPSPEDWSVHGTGSGHGFGMSHATSHDVPAGTCLYDQVDGEVVGVTLADQKRLGGQLGDDGWALVYIQTPWAVVSMRLKNLNSDATQPPRWDSCSEPAHRR